MKNYKFLVVLFVAIAIACNKVPLSNRKRLMLVKDAEMNAMALTSYKSFLDTNRVVAASNAQTIMVKRVGERIANAAIKYFEDHKKLDYLEGFAFETNLVENKEVNAWCMPGGKMVVYTGLLPISQTEEGLAVVMGHEVSHAIAKHGAERMSNSLFAQGILTAGQIGLGVAMGNKPAETQNTWNQVFGVVGGGGAQLGILKNGRKQELEADHLGLIFMAMAGYNPAAAAPFWERMAKNSEGSNKLPIFISTHPSDEDRIKQINKWLPEATKYYAKATGVTPGQKY